jgi:hypothetical protein
LHEVGTGGYLGFRSSDESLLGFLVWVILAFVLRDGKVSIKPPVHGWRCHNSPHTFAKLRFEAGLLIAENEHSLELLRHEQVFKPIIQFKNRSGPFTDFTGRCFCRCSRSAENILILV